MELPQANQGVQFSWAAKVLQYQPGAMPECSSSVCRLAVDIRIGGLDSRFRIAFKNYYGPCPPQKAHPSLTQRFPLANIHGEVRRERQSVEPYAPQEYNADERSPARADVMPPVFPAQGSCAAGRG